MARTYLNETQSIISLICEYVSSKSTSGLWVNPWATNLTLNLSTWPWESSLRVKISLCPIGGLSSLVEISTKTSCFLNEANSAFNVFFILWPIRPLHSLVRWGWFRLEVRLQKFGCKVDLPTHTERGTRARLLPTVDQPTASSTRIHLQPTHFKPNYRPRTYHPLHSYQ